MSTSISSVTGGGSTTRKSVQSEDSKAAEKQLETLKSQYDKDRAEIGNKIRETLGTDSTKGDVLKELRNNPEAKALDLVLLLTKVPHRRITYTRDPR